jgi:hypothetical protein
VYGDKPRRQLPMRIVGRPFIGAAAIAPPAVTASSQTVDFTCGKCATVLLQADEGQATYGVVIECLNCGAFNTTKPLARTSGSFTRLLAGAARRP